MSNTPETTETETTVDEQRAALADAFDRELDPLAEFAPTFDSAEFDPFDLFMEERIEPRDLTEHTRTTYRRVFEQWRDFMHEQGRHPACPSEEHVKDFIRHLRDDYGNPSRTIKMKLQKLGSAYEYWQEDAAFPHKQDHNPITSAKEKVNLDPPAIKEPPRLPVDELRDILTDVKHIRERAVIATQLKLGLRATETSNIKLADVDIQNTELREHYPDLGTNPRLDGHENAVCIPHDREGNKSKRPRVLPLDDELRRVILRYLLGRPDAGTPWLFLSPERHEQLRGRDVNDVWKDHFHPEYAETDEHRAVTSHFGRHRFTTFWRVEQDTPRELVKYMRGDKPGAGAHEDRGGIDHYIHSYYEDIEDLYRENIYRLGI